jgi:hypothetical protein
VIVDRDERGVRGGVQPARSVGDYRAVGRAADPQGPGQLMVDPVTSRAVIPPASSPM